MEEPPRRLGAYDLAERIGEGAFGAIYRATQPAVQREVAIKVVRAELANDPDFIRRFEVEAQLVARLEHPHIVPLYDFWREPGGAYLVMRYLRGGSAEQRLLRGGAIALDDVVQIAEEVGGALTMAHRSGVVHRDVKPANILFDEEGHAYLTDFGIATVGTGEGPLDLRSAGSPLYASPEQMRDGEATDHSDIYSFGVVLYELLTGVVPFSDVSSVKELAAHKLAEPLPSASALRPDLPDAIDAVLKVATDVQADRRFPSAADMVVAFRDAVATAAGRATAPGLGEPPETHRTSQVRTLVSVETEMVNPYRGLAAFGEIDAPDFHGRTRLTDELEHRLQDSKFLVVVGPSGSGKSSVVRAGLVPRARESGAYVVTLSPNTHPLDELETALHRVSPTSLEGLLDELERDERALHRILERVLPEADVLLVIDQFEELFTQSDPTQRMRFLELLRHGVQNERSRLRVVATLRADFYDRPLQDPDISELVRANTIAVTPLTAVELEAAIVRPAERMAVAVEPALVAELIGQVTANPASLPLMQYVLTELYDHREAGRMTLRAYESIGGLSGALASRADALASDVGAEATRLLFTPGEGAEDTRRRVQLSELDNVAGDVVEAYGKARLLTFDSDPLSREPTVEVAHEAIIREWPRLRAWLDEDRDGLRLVRQIAAGARSWMEAGRDVSELPRGARLEAASAWATEHPKDLTEVEHEFVGAGVTAEAAELERDRRRTRRLRLLLGATAVVAVVALIAGALAFQQQDRADSEAAAARTSQFDAETRRLASEAGFRVRTNRQVGLLLAAEAYQRDPGPESLGALQRALTNIDTFLGSYQSGLPVTAVGWLGEDRLVTAGHGGISVFQPSDLTTARRIPTRVRSELIDIGDAAFVTWTYFSEASDIVAAVPDHDHRRVEVHDLADPTHQIWVDHENEVHGLELSPDGSRLATIDSQDVLRLFDVRSGDELWASLAHPEQIYADLEAPTHYEPVTAFAFASFETFTTEKLRHRLVFSEDGAELYSQEGILRRWDAQSGAQLGDDLLLWRTRPERGEIPVISHPGVTFVVGVVGDVVAVHDQGSITTFDLSSGEQLTSAEIEAGTDMAGLAKIDSVAWRGGSTARVLLSDGRLGTVSLASGRFVEPVIDTQMLGTAGLAVSADERLAAVAGRSGVSVFGLDGSRAIASAVPRNGTHWGTITPDGDRITQDNADYVAFFSTGQVLDRVGADVTAGVRPDVVLYHYTPLAPGMMMGMDRNFRLVGWDLESGEALGPPLVMPGGWNGETATEDNRLLAAGTGDGGLIVFDTATGEPVVSFQDLGGFVPSMSFSPDGTRLAAASIDGEARVWSTTTWDPIDTPLGDGPGAVMALRYSPDGRYLVTMDLDGNVALRDPLDHQIVSRLIGNSALDIADGVFFFSDDGRYLMTAADGAARLWDLVEGVEIGDPFPNDADNRIGGADGVPRVVTAVGDYRLVWDLDVAAWPGLACSLAGRNLTVEEWQQFGPSDRPYRATCPQWPSLEEPEAASSVTLPPPRSSAGTADAGLAVVGDQDPVELGDQAGAEILSLLESGAYGAAEELCEAWEPRLVAASDTLAEIERSEIGIDRRHRFWTIDIAVNLCAGKGFDTAQTYLRAIVANPTGACVGYPSPCPNPRRWPQS